MTPSILTVKRRITPTAPIRPTHLIQTPATNAQISASLRLNACRRVTGTISSSSSGNRTVTELSCLTYGVQSSTVTVNPAFVRPQQESRQQNDWRQKTWN
jgi:hypothetical protein